MNKARKEYVPPVAELIQLQPSEALASWDWGYTERWKNPGYRPGAGGIASAIIAAAPFSGYEDDDGWEENGFTIVKK